MNKVLMIPVVVLLLAALFISSASAEWLYATDGKTFVHTQPDIDSERIGVFRPGQKIWVYDHTYTPDGRNWCEVIFEGQEAYISDRYSSYEVNDDDSFVDINHDYDQYPGWWDEEAPYEQEDEFEFMTEFHFKAMKDTEVFEWPYYGDKVAVIRKGEIVTGSIIYSSRDGAWIEVPINDGDGYGFVDVNTLNIQEGSFPKLSSIMKVTGNTIHVRADADINSESLMIINRDTRLFVDYFVCVYDEEFRIWAHCSDKYGHEMGFASCKYLASA